MKKMANTEVRQRGMEGKILKKEKKERKKKQ